MLSQETKRKIDSARNILVGKVPDPKAQVEQITTALIYKFMDDMDKEAIELGGKARFFINGFEKYTWTKLMDPKVGGQERLELYAEAITKMWQNSHLPQLFRDIFKDAFLPYRSPETLSMFLKEINGFSYDHSEDLGDAFEYLLSILGSQGDAGQFRTPRHIIDFIVQAIDPKKDETILDPACGTAGFLISAYKHILKQNHNKPLTPDEKKKLMKNLSGYDISPDMVKLSKVNMYLHGFAEPKIYEYDTLSSEEKWDEMFDVMMANPPFMSPRGGIKPHKRFSVQANRSEVLFVDYILEHLRPNGRAGIIVPEGIIFQSAGAYKALRKMLVEDGLFAVVSLPAGVFNPYAGVKTSILIFDNRLAKKTDEILFIKVLNDGYELGAQRRPRPDLPNDLFGEGGALDVIKAQKIAIETGNKNTLVLENSFFAWLVKKDKIAETGDYNLSGDRYREIVGNANQKWPMVELGGVIKFLPKSNRRAGDGLEGGKYPFFTSSQIQSKYLDETDYKEEALILGTGGMASVHISNDFSTSADVFVIKSNTEKLKNKFIYLYLKGRISLLEAGFKGGGLKHLSKEYLKSIKLPLPSLKIQEQIVEQIEKYQNIIDGAKQIVTNWKSSIDIDPEWKWLKVEDITDNGKNSIKAGPFGSSLKKEIYVKDGYKIYGQEQVIKGNIDYGNYYINEQTFKKLKSCSVKAGDILISLVGTYGKLLIVPEIFKPGVINPRLMKITLDKGKCLPMYFKAIFESDEIKNQVNDMSYGGTMGILNTKILRKMEMPIPPLEIQKQIVEKIEAERALVEGNKKLIKIYEQKIADVLSKI